jgi:N-carbamoylputrescine amidase
VGTEGDLTFWGNSFVSDPFGRILHVTSSDKEEFAIVEVDFETIDDTRIHWPFFRDRRVDLYGDLTQKYL